MTRHAPDGSHAKRQPSADPDHLDRDLIARVEERLAATSARDKTNAWKLAKKHPQDRSDLIILARNLDAMLSRLPHGRKVEALEKAGFGGAEQSGYRGNLTIPPDVVEVRGDRLRRLTPHVRRYLDVAQAIEGDRHRAIADLFRGTSLGRKGAGDLDWADRLSHALRVMAAGIDARTKLGLLFDQLSKGNVHLAETGALELRITDWLSETFHKFDFTDRAVNDGFWLFDRNDETTPLCGAPLFCPKIAIARRRLEWRFESGSLTRDGADVAEQAGPVSLHGSTTLHLALAPEAATLDTPATIAPWFLERPVATLVRQGQSDEPVWRICLEDGIIKAWTDTGLWSLESIDAVRDDSVASLLISAHENTAEDPDLAGSWWCMPVTPSQLRANSDNVPDEILLRASPQKGDLSRVIGNADDPDRLDFHAHLPSIYAPLNSIANAIQNAMAGGQLSGMLEQEVAVLAAARRTLLHHLTSNCAIADLMLNPVTIAP